MSKTPLFVRKQSGGLFAVVDETKVTGNIWFVDSGSATGADAAGYGQNPDAPFLTLDYAIGQCTASNGDTIYLMPGHAETLTAAGAVTMDVIGVTVIGIGEGASRPTFTFSSTDNSATFLLTAASNVVRNILGVCGDDGLTSAFVVSAADCELDITWRDPTDVEAVTCILTTAGADRLKIKLKYEGYTGGNACVSPIQLIGVNEGDITVDFYGKASTSVVDMLTTLSSGIRVRGYFYNSGTTDLSKNVTANIGSCLWFAQGYDGAAGKSFSGGSAAAIASDDVSAIASDLVVTQSDVKGLRAGTTSDMVVLKSDIAGLRTGGTSDVVVLKALLTTATSDLVILQASEDSDMVVIKSDVVSCQSNIAALKSDFLIFITKYASDNP
jgi:hypothetical protein